MEIGQGMPGYGPVEPTARPLFLRRRWVVVDCSRQRPPLSCCALTLAGASCKGVGGSLCVLFGIVSREIVISQSPTDLGRERADCEGNAY
jgi:hypothetical protein